jgi:hypothetical protein
MQSLISLKCRLPLISFSYLDLMVSTLYVDLFEILLSTQTINNVIHPWQWESVLEIDPINLS